MEEFKRYYKKSGIKGDLEHLTRVVIKDQSQLIVWKKNDEIVGHAVWHESTTEEHRSGELRDREDREALEKLLRGKRGFVELHEVWLMREYRGEGYGKRFFDFFGRFMRSRGYDSIIYYASHPAAIAICRERGCNEDYLESEGEYVFLLSLKQSGA